MKAFLLAAGEGTRLRPLTLQTPKCLVRIGGKPLIEYWFNLFRKHGIDEILINTSYLADKVQKYINRQAGDLRIHVTHEETLLGSGGTIKKNWDFVSRENSFFICYADNLTNISLSRMADFHNAARKDMTLALFRVPNPRECGIVEIDAESTITAFTEKPINPASDLAFAGIVLSSGNLPAYFPDREVFDLGYDVLPRIAGKAAGYIVREYLIDIGTPEKLRQAEHDMVNNNQFGSSRREQ